MTAGECRKAVKQFFSELYPDCTVITAYPGQFSRPSAPYIVLEFNRVLSSSVRETVTDGILYQVWFKTMPFTAEMVLPSRTFHQDGSVSVGASTVVDDLAQSVQFFQSAYACDKMRALNIAITVDGNPEQIYNSVSGVERARCSFYVDFAEPTKEYASLHPQDGEYLADHPGAAAKEVADMQAGYFTNVDEIEAKVKE